MTMLTGLDDEGRLQTPPAVMATPTPSPLNAPALPAVPTAAAPRGSLLALRFVSDHALLRREESTFGSSGKLFSKPEWRPKSAPQGQHSYPITQTRQTYVKVWLVLELEPAGMAFDLKGDGGASYVRFEKKRLVSTGGRQAVAVRSQAKLPNELSRIVPSITWTATTKTGQVKLGTTGPHEIFVTWGRPTTTSSIRKANHPTVKRLRGLLDTGSLSGEKNLLGIAKGIQHFVDTWVPFGPEPHIMSLSGDQIWALLDKGSCQCGGGSTLAEMASRVLGVPATQKHVKAVTTLPIRVSSAASPMAPETRQCALHGNETLILLFRISPASLNDGEGCNVIGGRFFPSHVDGVGMVGMPSGRRSAAHHVLLQLEAATQAKIGYFQVWCHANTPGVWTVCGLPSATSGAGDPYPPVPKAT